MHATKDDLSRRLNDHGNYSSLFQIVLPSNTTTRSSHGPDATLLLGADLQIRKSIAEVSRKATDYLSHRWEELERKVAAYRQSLTQDYDIDRERIETQKSALVHLIWSTAPAQEADASLSSSAAQRREEVMKQPMIMLRQQDDLFDMDSPFTSSITPMTAPPLRYGQEISFEQSLPLAISNPKPSIAQSMPVAIPLAVSPRLARVDEDGDGGTKTPFVAPHILSQQTYRDNPMYIHGDLPSSTNRRTSK
jgi:hypothetical protein